MHLRMGGQDSAAKTCGPGWGGTTLFSTLTQSRSRIPSLDAVLH